MKNQKGISLIALIITIIVIIILAAIVIGGVFNTPNDAKFANFCQEYDRIQTAIQLKYYELYQNYAINASLTTLPTHYDIYEEVATGTAVAAADSADTSKWVEITNFGTASKNICVAPTGLEGWFLRTNDGKLAYSGFEKSEKVMYYTPNVSKTGTGTGAAARPTVGIDSSATQDLNAITSTTADLSSLAK